MRFQGPVDGGARQLRPTSTSVFEVLWGTQILVAQTPGDEIYDRMGYIYIYIYIYIYTHTRMNNVAACVVVCIASHCTRTHYYIIITKVLVPPKYGHPNRLALGVITCMYVLCTNSTYIRPKTWIGGRYNV